MVALPGKHPLAAHRRLPLRARANETLIVFPLHMSPGRNELIIGMCRRSHVIHEVDNVPTMLDLIGAGFGVSLMRASVMDVPCRGVVFRELQHSPAVETGLAFCRENTLNALPLLLEVAKNIAKNCHGHLHASAAPPPPPQLNDEVIRGTNQNQITRVLAQSGLTSDNSPKRFVQF